jgi:Tol biopolymer transport system component
VLNVASGNVRPLSPEADSAPAYWSPDSTQIAFSSITPDRNTGLRVIDIDGDNLVTLAEPRTVWSVVWLSEGKELAFVAPGTTNAVEASGLNASGLNASGLNASGLNASGLNARRLRALPANWLDTTISPDGSQIAYLGDDNGYGGVFDLFIATLDGTNPRLLVQNPGNRRCLRWPF